MQTAWNQRWIERRGIYRPADEVINTRRYEVSPIQGDAIAKAFITRHHYSGTYPAARYRFGLYHSQELVGVAVFSHPSNDKVLAIFPGRPIESAELGRFVLNDTVPGNGETWFLARCFELLRHAGIIGIVSFSDQIARQAFDGRTIFAGHVGTIYQAHNATYLGRATARRLKILPDGTVLSDRTVQKIRAQEKGHQYATRLLETFGAEPISGCPVAWLDQWLPKLTRPLAHPGNHKYAWMLQKAHRRHLLASAPFPKFVPTAKQLGLFA